MRYTWLARIAALSASLGLSGCFTIQTPEFTQACPKYQLPALPDKAKLIIDGNKVEADQGGEIILRNYVNARTLLK